MPETEIIITCDTSCVSAKQIADLLGSVNFGASADYLDIADFKERFFAPNIFGILALDAPAGALIGMARIFSDNMLTSWISEICVAPPYQGVVSGRS